MRKITVFAIIISMAMASCKKNDNTSSTPSTLNCQLSTIVFNPDSVSNKSIDSIKYNSAGKVIRISFTGNSGQYYGFYIYTYTSSSVTVKSYSNTNLLQDSTVYILGSNGYASSCNVTPVHENPDFNTYSYTYSYSSTGYLIKQTQVQTVPPGSGSTLVSTYTYTAGNCTGETDISYFPGSSNGDTTIITYQYNSTKISVSLNSFSGFFSPLGMPNTNLLISSTFKSKDNVNTDAHTYTYDSNNNPISETIVSTHTQNGIVSKSTSKVNYTYSCH